MTVSDSAPELDNIVQEIALLKQASETSEIANESWSALSEACKMIADTARSVPPRTPLGEKGVIESLAKLFEKSSGQQNADDIVSFQIQALRVLGNLCFDHENNRKRVLDSDIVKKVSPFLKGERIDLTHTVCAFYLNCSLDYPPIQTQMMDYGVVKTLLELVDTKKMENDEEDSIVVLCVRILDILAAEDATRPALSSVETVDRYLDMIDYLWKQDELDYITTLQQLTDSLFQIIMDDDSLQNEIIDHGSLGLLLDILEDTRIRAEEDEKENYDDILKTVNRIAVYAVSTDSKMDELYNNQELLSRFLRMATSKSDVVHQCAVYALGNLARSDAHCIELVEKYNLATLLLDLYKSTENATFQYAILGCLKHLCLPVSNKVIIGNTDCISTLSPVLDESKDMLKRNQFLTIGIFKLLCTNNYKNSEKIVSGGSDSTLSLIMAFLKRVDDVAAKSEATRILTNLVKSIWSESSSTHLREVLVESHIIEPIMELVRTSKFPILKNDGILALVLIFSDRNPDTKEVLFKALPLAIAEPPSTDLLANNDEESEGEKPETRTFLGVLADDICLESSEMPVQIKSNACILLCNIVEAARLAQDQSAIIDAIKSQVFEGLKTVKKDSEMYTYAYALIKDIEQ